MRLYKLAVLVSGGGSNLQAIIDSIQSGMLHAEIALVVSDQQGAYALERAQSIGIPTAVIKKDTEALLEALRSAEVDGIILAGYLSILPKAVIAAYEGRILNIHPSLIPKYCGKGFYGIHVHRAVIEAGERESGATVHFVDEGIDTGAIILQERVAVLPKDTAESLQKRVLEIEHRILPRAIAQVFEEQEG